jgi:HPt (histidine-containing phosphotransfer) domain-containing protein
MADFSDPRPWSPPETLRHLEASGRASLISELVSDFASDTRARLARMRHAIAAADAALFRSEARGVEGNAAQMGGRQLAALAKALELEGASMPSWALREGVAEMEGELEALCRDMRGYMTRRSG